MPFCAAISAKNIRTFDVRERAEINESEKQKYQSEKMLHRDFYILVPK